MKDDSSVSSSAHRTGAILLTEMSNVRGRLGMELGSFLRDVWSKMNYHIKMLARKATVICHKSENEGYILPQSYELLKSPSSCQ